MDITIALSLVLVAGVVNGSFAMFSKRMQGWAFENIWFNYALWAFIIIPWVSIFIMAPNILSLYAHAPIGLIAIIAVGGFVFGIGQVCFALAMDKIGLGLGFLLNIGLGTALGSLLPLLIQHSEEIATPFGLITIAAVALIIVGLLLSYYAGLRRDREIGHGHVSQKSTGYAVGVIFAIIAGFASAGQNVTFSLTMPLHQIAEQMHFSPLITSIVIWPVFLLFSFIPYSIFMLTKLARNKRFHCYTKANSGRYHVYTFLMGLFWYGSLILYSKSAQLVGHLGPVVIWPLFMVLIILTSNYWGWHHHEWRGSSRKTRKTILSGIGFLIAAIIILSLAA